MKRAFGWVLLTGMVLTIGAEADIVERSFVRGATGDITSGYVLQGSRNMRDLGKNRRSRASSTVVSQVSSTGMVIPTQTVIPELQNHVLQPKPRFGYGSDYRPEENPAETPVIVPAPSSQGATATVSPVTVPNYTFYSNYQPRQYFRTYRYPFGTSLFGGFCGAYSPYRPLFHSYRPTFSGFYQGSNWAIGFRW